MKKIFILIMAGMSLATLPACNKYLDIKPKGYTIPEYFEDYQKLFNSQVLVGAVAAYPGLMTDDVIAGDDMDVNSHASYSFLNQYKRNIYSFVPGQVFEQNEKDQQWEPSYSNIFVYNTIINNVMAVKDASEQEKIRLRADAQIARAFEYLTLVNLYAEQYDPATASSALGVPLVLSEDINLPYERKSIAAIYTQIKQDIEEAMPNLQEKVLFNSKPSKSAAYGFLSRVNLYMGDYKAALENANKALEQNNLLLNYAGYATKKGTWGRVYNPADSSSFPDGYLDKETIWLRTGGSSSGHLFEEVYASADLISVFKKDLPTGAVDKRFNLFYCDGVSNTGSKEILFPGRVLWAPWIDFNLGFGTPELYLNAAESEARIGSKDRALQLINTLRNSRITNNQPLVAADNEAALRLVLEERRRELAFRGYSRLADLKRLNKDARFAKTITHTHNGQTFTLPANDKRYIFPVPPNVLAINPGIPQYER
ncbi:RagB/SusD family nutrient uptake outer membrane protein [Chitinophaga qingshengii]|uniref:RagB/SusD family nutrient uptake outer membrane protein n=1 Tax=Chitinophaga qingshengii TaxID=1569794 RepID=A0ABR7TQB5_9BACT|nr:RagB/SusD family nutrient uptake outer membrane protein [Chitinophaga qingshengii]MBC9931209.1 RagB/SusD family nutrient uptake outer membrane protein [Chitinophaga qingshengii]